MYVTLFQINVKTTKYIYTICISMKYKKESNKSLMVRVENVLKWKLRMHTLTVFMHLNFIHVRKVFFINRCMYTHLNQYQRVISDLFYADSQKSSKRHSAIKKIVFQIILYSLSVNKFQRNHNLLIYSHLKWDKLMEKLWHQFFAN